ncbi:LytTR family transcriptional regulator DNA-binding domain-containing protein [Paenibacillus thailandensis]|uniref:LytTR family transcriptional regulator DNA-binding domain-containing protein n=1 Tax=Paenibacillus thailandensis TaxID=393250 RepID=A0ABW5R255_9BACL
MVEALPVAKDVAGESGLYLMPIEKMIYLEGISAKKVVAVHTLDDVGYMNGTIKYWETALNSTGYNFKYSFRDILVNLDNVQLLDKFRKNVYFENIVTKNSKKCPIASGATFDEFVKVLQSLNPKLNFI